MEIQYLTGNANFVNMDASAFYTNIPQKKGQIICEGSNTKEWKHHHIHRIEDEISGFNFHKLTNN